MWLLAVGVSGTAVWDGTGVPALTIVPGAELPSTREEPPSPFSKSLAEPMSTMESSMGSGPGASGLAAGGPRRRKPLPGRRAKKARMATAAAGRAGGQGWARAWDRAGRCALNGCCTSRRGGQNDHRAQLCCKSAGHPPRLSAESWHAPSPRPPTTPPTMAPTLVEDPEVSPSVPMVVPLASGPGAGAGPLHRPRKSGG